MECGYKINGVELRIILPAELDHHVASRIQSETDLLVDTYHIRRIVFDFKATEFMDSSGIGVILGRYRKMNFSGGQIKAQHLKPRMLQILRMSGLESIVDTQEW